MGESRPLAVELSFTVKTYDTDFAGIVHNMVYVRWLEDLRLKILEEHLPLEVLLAGGTGPILTRTEIDYRRPVRLGDRPLGRMWVSELGRARWEVQAEILLGEEVAAAAVQKGYFADMKTLRPVPVPAEFRDRWSAARRRNARP